MYKTRLFPFARRAAAILIAFLTLSVTGCTFGAGDGNALPSETALPSPAQEAEEHSPAGAFREATLYYVSDEGFVVPVKKLIPWEEGIAKACLACITSTPVNDAAAAELGLNTVLPRGTKTALSISGGEARLDLIDMAPLASAQAERSMLAAVVDTLTEFATVECVTITRQGEGGTLENGTELPVRQPRYDLNIEQTELAVSAGATAGTLYFPNLSGAVTVPVTRYFSAQPTLYAAVSALIQGPASDKLMCCFPEGTLLLGAALENGVVTVNLSEDFKAVEQTYGMYSLAYKTVLMTLKEGFSFDKLVIQVNGRTYAPELASQP